MLYKYPEHPIEQHAISLNMVPIGSQNQVRFELEVTVVFNTQKNRLIFTARALSNKPMAKWSPNLSI